jgi:uncharacterized protein
MSWILTASNKQIDFLNPDPNQITIEDIATGLSNQPRFAGQLSTFYSVAEHCIIMERLFIQLHNPDEGKGERGWVGKVSRAILLHDATEAYMCDVPTPLKNLMPDYLMIEDRLNNRIRDKFKISYGPGVQNQVKKYDLIMLKNEALARGTETHWLSDEKYKDVPVIPNFGLYRLHPNFAKELFLKRWEELNHVLHNVS